MVDRDADRVELILEVASLIEARLDGWSRTRFFADRDEIDLAAYRLSVSGETANKLSDVLKFRHPDVGWAELYGMRNIIAHDYGRMDPVRIWEALKGRLPALVEALRKEARP